MLLGFEFSPESNNQSETLEISVQLRHQYGILWVQCHTTRGETCLKTDFLVREAHGAILFQCFDVLRLSRKLCLPKKAVNVLPCLYPNPLYYMQLSSHSESALDICIQMHNHE